MMGRWLIVIAVLFGFFLIGHFSNDEDAEKPKQEQAAKALPLSEQNPVSPKTQNPPEAKTLAPQPRIAEKKPVTVPTKEKKRLTTTEYGEWLHSIQQLEKQLAEARSQNWLADKNHLANLSKWGQFARQFRETLQSKRDEVGKLHSVQDRILVGAPLGYLFSMFHATAFQRENDYHEFQGLYKQELAALEALVPQTKPKLKIEPKTNTPSTPNPEPKPDPEEQERKASAKLRLADKLYSDGKFSTAERWYADIVRDYPGTKAAQAAQKKQNVM